MDIKQLKIHLEKVPEKLSPHDRILLNARLHSLISVFPFNEYEYMLMFLLDRNVLRFEEYEKLRNKYVSENKYLDLYEIAPRIFGEMWHQHIIDLDKRFSKPSKKLDPNFSPGEYDLWIEGIRIEVKASRAVNKKKGGSLSSKALNYGSTEPFWMNFQQIKLKTCDVFIFIGVWVGQIVYWVLSLDDIKKNEYFSHQHREGVEYQIGITQKNIQKFDKYKVAPLEIARVVIVKGKNI